MVIPRFQMVSAGIMSTTSGSGQTLTQAKRHYQMVITRCPVLLQAQAHTHILSVLVLIRTPLRLAHMDTITVNAAGNAENTVKNIRI